MDVFTSVFQENSRQDKKYKWQVLLLMSVFPIILSKNNEINKQIKKKTPTPTTAIE